MQPVCELEKILVEFVGPYISPLGHTAQTLIFLGHIGVRKGDDLLEELLDYAHANNIKVKNFFNNLRDGNIDPMFFMIKVVGTYYIQPLIPFHSGGYSSKSRRKINRLSVKNK